MTIERLTHDIARFGSSAFLSLLEVIKTTELKFLVYETGRRVLFAGFFENLKYI